jgi:hypothetical protein
MEPFLGKIYTSIIPVSDQDEAYERMIHDRLPHQIFVEKYDPARARLITDSSVNMRKGKVDLIYSSFNRLRFRVISEQPAFFALSYPYTGHWNAWLNGKPIHLYRANGASHALELPNGESLIEFRYWSPAAFWGIVISCATFAVIGFYVCFISLVGLRRIMATAFFLVTATGLVILWNYSLYTGDNLGTRYTWTYTPPESKPNNIAYGKKTSNLPVPQGIFYMWYLKGGQYINHSGRIVDGNRSKGSGFKTRPGGKSSVYVDLDGNVTHMDKNRDSVYREPIEETPSVTIDLNDKKRIHSIVIYASKYGTSVVKCNIELLISPDQKNWESVASVTPDLESHHPINIELDSQRFARYIQLKVIGTHKVIFDEVEVY